MADPVALDRMAEVVPDARLLAILRDPADRAYSHYWMERIREREARSFEDAVAAEPDYLARGRYLPQLEEVCRRFPREHLDVILLDDLRDEPAATYAGVCRFLGVDPDFRSPRLGDRVNRFVAFRSMSVRRIRRRLPKTFRIGRIVGRLNAVEGEYPPMDPDTRARLVSQFEPDNAALAEWLGRDLSAWRDPLAS
jgi:hypothetical protein